MTSSKTVLRVVPVVLILAVFAQCSVAAEQEAKTSGVIVLQHSVPSEIMVTMGLVSKEDSEAGKPGAWVRPATVGDSAAKNVLAPEGVDGVVPYDADKSLILYGTADGIERFRRITEMLDVVPKQVQIKGEFYRVPVALARQIGLDVGHEMVVGSAGLVVAPKDLVRSALKKANVSPSATPTVITVNNRAASISITTQTSSEAGSQPTNIEASLSVTPRVNGDGTITLIIDAKAPRDLQAGKQALSDLLKVQRRIGPDDSMVIIAQPAGPDVLVVVVTPTVVEAASTRSSHD